MSTPATYTFHNSKDLSTSVVNIYRHWDGDLKGAAVWFVTMFALKPGTHGRWRGDLATRFIVGNQRDAEINGKRHFDTAFTYIVDYNDKDSWLRENYDNATVRVFENDNYDAPRLVYSGSLYDFIIEHVDRETAVKWLEGEPLTKKNIRKAYNHCKRISKRLKKERGVA